MGTLLILMSLMIAASCGRAVDADSKARVEAAGPALGWARDHPSCRNDPAVGRVGSGTPPRVVSKVEPALAASAAPIRGIVIVEAVIDPEGRPCSIVVLKPLRGDADAAAIEAVKGWSFVPSRNWKDEPQFGAYNISLRIEHLHEAASQR